MTQKNNSVFCKEISGPIMWAIVFLLIIFAMGCSSSNKLANKAIADPVAYAKVGKDYILKNGCLSDTPQVKYLPGKVKYVAGQPVLTYVPVHDTITNKVPCDSFTAKTKGGSTVTVDKSGNLSLSDEKGRLNTSRIDTFERNDTTIFTLVDKTRFNIAMDSLQWYRVNKIQLDADLKVSRGETALTKAERNGWRLKFYGLLALFLLLVGFGVYLKIKKKILL